MEEQLITFKTAKLAKDKGFDEPVLAIYSGNQLGYIQEGDKLFRKWNHCRDATYSAPTQSLLQKWLREKHTIDICIESYRKHSTKVYGQQVFYGEFIPTDTGFIRKTARKNSVFIAFLSYEEAFEVGLQEGLKLITK